MSRTHGFGFIATSEADNQNILERLNKRVKPTDLFEFGLIPGIYRAFADCGQASAS
jgi:ATP-dependent Clp protease ATP-binding subunit ClpX